MIQEHNKIIVVISNSNPVELDTTNNTSEISYPIYPTLQSRINEANAGDTVLVEPCTYFENLTLKNGVVLKSRFGPEVTIIDGQQEAVTIGMPAEWEIDRSTLVDGFTITNGLGGLGLRQASPVIRNNVIIGNSGNGVDLAGPAIPLIERNVIAENDPCGIRYYSSKATIINNTIVKNKKVGIGGQDTFVAKIEKVENNIIWGNEDDLAGGSSIYSCIEDGDPGRGNIADDPQFVDYMRGDYRLLPTSPCINRGNPRGPRDPDGTRADMGAFYYDLSGFVGSVEVTVVDSVSGESIHDAWLRLSGIDIDEARTDSTGKFIFIVREGANYSLVAYLVNYWPKQIDGISIAVDDTQHIEIQLSPIIPPLRLYPPRNLTAEVDSIDASVVKLQWDHTIEEIAFDDGIFEAAFMFANFPGIAINGPFIPSHYPSIVDRALASFEWEQKGDTFCVWFLIDSTAESIGPLDSLWVVGVIDDVIDDPCYFQEFDLTFLELTLDESIALYLGIQQLWPSPDYTFINIDDDAPDSNSWFGYPGIGWARPGGAFAIRAVVTPQSSLGSSQVMATINKYSPNFSKQFQLNVLSGKTTLPDRERIVVNRISHKQIQRFALHKTTAMLGYNIYRSPVYPIALTDSNRVNKEEPIDTTAFRDTGLIHDGLYYYTVTAVYTQEESLPSNEDSVLVVGTVVESIELATLPKDFALEQNYPNPFNPETTIRYQLPKTSEVIIKIYNITGQLVVKLVEKQQPAGYYSINWNGKDETGQDVASGLYFYQIRAKGSKENFIQVRKMLLVR